MYLDGIWFKMTMVIVQLVAPDFFCIKNVMWWWVLIVLLFVLVIMLLFTPLQLYINTATNDYFVRVGHLAKAFLEADTKEIFRFRIRAMGFQYSFYPLKTKSSDNRKKKNPKKTQKKKRPEARKLVWILRAFKVNTFECSVDTGNFVANAQLYPFLGFINHHVAKCRINFEGIDYLMLDIRSRPFTLLKSFINH